MPGSIRVSVLESSDLPIGPTGSYGSFKVSIGAKQCQTQQFEVIGGKTKSYDSHFIFPVLKFRDNLVVMLINENGEAVSHAEIEVPIIISNGSMDDLFNLKGGGRVHLRLSFVLSAEEYKKIQSMREAVHNRKLARFKQTMPTLVSFPAASIHGNADAISKGENGKENKNKDDQITIIQKKLHKMDDVVSMEDKSRVGVTATFLESRDSKNEDSNTPLIPRDEKITGVEETKSMQNITVPQEGEVISDGKFMVKTENFILEIKDGYNMDDTSEKHTVLVEKEGNIKVEAKSMKDCSQELLEEHKLSQDKEFIEKSFTSTISKEDSSKSVEQGDSIKEAFEGISTLETCSQVSQTSEKMKNGNNTENSSRFLNSKIEGDCSKGDSEWHPSDMSKLELEGSVFPTMENPVIVTKLQEQKAVSQDEDSVANTTSLLKQHYPVAVEVNERGISSIPRVANDSSSSTETLAASDDVLEPEKTELKEEEEHVKIQTESVVPPSNEHTPSSNADNHSSYNNSFESDNGTYVVGSRQEDKDQSLYDYQEPGLEQSHNESTSPGSQESLFEKCDITQSKSVYSSQDLHPSSEYCQKEPSNKIVDALANVDIISCQSTPEGEIDSKNEFIELKVSALSEQSSQILDPSEIDYPNILHSTKGVLDSTKRRDEISAKDDEGAEILKKISSEDKMELKDDDSQKTEFQHTEDSKVSMTKPVYLADIKAERSDHLKNSESNQAQTDADQSVSLPENLNPENKFLINRRSHSFSHSSAKKVHKVYYREKIISQLPTTDKKKPEAIPTGNISTLASKFKPPSGSFHTVVDAQVELPGSLRKENKDLQTNVKEKIKSFESGFTQEKKNASQSAVKEKIKAFESKLSQDSRESQNAAVPINKSIRISKEKEDALTTFSKPKDELGKNRWQKGYSRLEKCSEKQPESHPTEIISLDEACKPTKQEKSVKWEKGCSCEFETSQDKGVYSHLTNKKHERESKERVRAYTNLLVYPNKSETEKHLEGIQQSCQAMQQKLGNGALEQNDDGVDMLKTEEFLSSQIVNDIKESDTEDQTQDIKITEKATASLEIQQSTTLSDERKENLQDDRSPTLGLIKQGLAVTTFLAVGALSILSRRERVIRGAHST